MSAKHNLEKEFQFYLENQEDLVKKYNGRYIVIRDQKVVGDYVSPSQAYEQSKTKYELGTFLIQFCTPGTNSYKQTYHSRVTFK